jgi:hypothetical protein
MQMPGMPQMPYMQQPAMPQMPYMQQPAAPQMPYVPQPVIPQVTPPQVVVAPVQAPASSSTNVVLIAIFCLLAFLAGGIVVYLLVRH